MFFKKPNASFLQWAKYGGLNREDHLSIRGAMREKNYSTLRRSSFIGTVLLGGLLGASFFVRDMARLRNTYAMFLALFAVMYLVTSLLVSKRKTLALPVFYVTLGLAFAFGIIIGVVQQPALPATTFCVLLFALPLLLVDQPLRTTVLMAVATAAFCVCSVSFKEPNISTQDLVNSVSFLVLGVAVNHYMMTTKLRDLLNQSIIERERDTDDLTKMLGKTAGRRMINQYMEDSRMPAAFLLLDVDNFKQVNDSLGHAYGDSVLRVLGDCMHECFRDSDVITRVGGDEFVLFLPEISSRDQIDACIRRLTESINDRFKANEHYVPVTLSVGVALYPRDSADFNELFEMADHAMYSSKRGGKNTISFYSEGGDSAKGIS